MKKKTCFKILGLLTALTLLLTSCSSSGDGDTELKDGQTLSYAQIVSINGNEVTLAWATATSSENMTMSEDETRGNSAEGETNDASLSGDDNSETVEDSQQMPGGGEMPDNSDVSGGQMPDNSDMSGGQMPGGDMSGGQMPGGGDMSGGPMSGGSDDSGNSSSDSSTDSADDSSNNKSDMQEKETEETIIYTLTGEEDTMYIPVGTTVTTELGATTTFSRLASGDMLKLVLEQDSEGNNVIVAVSIVQ